jgi:hypothetical protein
MSERYACNYKKHALNTIVQGTIIKRANVQGTIVQETNVQGTNVQGTIIEEIK